MIVTILTSMRIRHWIKNLFVLIPILVSGSFFDFVLIRDSLLALISFCLVSSTVYFFNDIIDVEKDKLHEIKKQRPIASGKISILLAYIIIVLILITVIFIQYFLSHSIFLILGLYLFININYSLWMKNIAILDIICISSGFVLRVLAGVIATGLVTSGWLLSMTFTLSMLLALGKRKAELKKTKNFEARISLKKYTESNINNMQNVFVSCTLIFYILYTNLTENFTGDKNFLLFSSIFVVAGLLKYIQITSEESNMEQPTDILYKDKFILISVLLWASIIILSFI